MLKLSSRKVGYVRVQEMLKQILNGQYNYELLYIGRKAGGYQYTTFLII